MITRRFFLSGLFAAVAAPAILPPDNLMRVRGVVMRPLYRVFGMSDGREITEEVFAEDVLTVNRWSEIRGVQALAWAPGRAFNIDWNAACALANSALDAQAKMPLMPPHCAGYAPGLRLGWLQRQRETQVAIRSDV